MDIVNAERIREFIRHYPQSASALERWELITSNSTWRTFNDLRSTFNSADYVNGKVVFNIGGNKYRLIAIVDYKGQQVIVRPILTHTEYDREKWKS